MLYAGWMAPGRADYYLTAVARDDDGVEGCYLLAGPAWQDTFTDWQDLARSGLVWTYGDGSPIHPKTLYERFLRLSAEAGLPRIRLHA